MKLDNEDVFEPEDMRTINTRENFRKRLTNEDVKLSSNLPVLIRYDYLDLEATDYHFKQTFHHEDTIGYFSRMKQFAGQSVNQLLSNSHAFHFYRSELRGSLLKAVRSVMPHAIDIDQIIYHFSLYNSDRWADRITDSRNTRVYFMLGTYGHIYILFFDPYHELNPLPQH